MFKKSETNRNIVKEEEAERRNLNEEERIITVSETELKNLNGIESRKISVTPIIERPVKNVSSQAIQEQVISSSVESLGNGDFDKLIGWNDSASKRKQEQNDDNINNPQRNLRKTESQSVLNSNSLDASIQKSQNNSLVDSATSPTENNTPKNSNLGIIGAIAAVVASAGLVVGKILKK